MKPKHVVLLGALFVALAFMVFSCGDDSNDKKEDGPVKCITTRDCPQNNICVQGICKEKPSTTDGDEELDTTENTSDGDEETTDSTDQIPCSYICCSDADCIPPDWTPDQPAWYCDNPNTPQASCKQEAAPCEYECCSTADCVNKDPNHCETWFCNNRGTPDAECVNDMDIYELGHQYCEKNENVGTWIYYEAVMKDGCKVLETKECDRIKDCEENGDGTISCIRSERCREDSDCVSPLKCDYERGFPDIGLGRCLMPQAGEGDICMINVDQQSGNGDWVAECYPPPQNQDDQNGLVCCIDPNQQCSEGTTGVCGWCRPKSQCQ